MPAIRNLVLVGAALVAAAALVAGGAAGPSSGAAAGFTWTVVPTPDVAAVDNDLTAVSCPSSTFCAAVGTQAIETWNGIAWALAPASTLPAATFLGGVSCTSASSCEAVGFSISSSDHQVPLAESWNGHSWARQSVPLPAGAQDATLQSDSCLSASSCTAVGGDDNGAVDHTVVEAWNGTTWSIAPSPSPTATGAVLLTGVSCVSSSFCAAVGYDAVSNSVEQTLVELWNGATWKIVPSPNPAPSGTVQLLGVSCVSGSFCTAVGYGIESPEQSTPPDLIETWNGSIWTDTSSAALLAPLDGVTCPSATRCVAVGAGQGQSPVESATVVANWNGTTWTQATTPNAGNLFNQLNGVSCPTAPFCMAVGYSENTGGRQQALAEEAANRTPTKLVLTSTRAVRGRVVRITAAVSPTTGSGAPTGTVLFVDDTTGLTIGAEPLRDGKATILTVFQAKGNYTITARYSGDPNFAPSIANHIVTVVGRHVQRRPSA